MARPPAIQKGEIKELLKKRDKVVLTTGDIAKALDVHRNTAHDRLKKLEQSGEVQSDTMGSADVWYLSNDDPRVEPALSQRWSLVGVMQVVPIAVLVGYVGIAWGDVMTSWLVSNSAVVNGVLLAVLTFIAVYPWVVIARLTFSPGRGLTLGELRAALMGADR